MPRRFAIALGSAIPLVTLIACATSPLGRTQLRLFPEADMAAMGVAAYDKMKTELPISRDPAANRYVRCVTGHVTAALGGPEGRIDWEVTVFQEESANAFALPGGKIGVHTGLLRVARNQEQLATVIGHELAHVIAGHGNERVSTAYAAQTGLQMVESLAGAPSLQQQQLMAALGVGAQLGVLLPFSRAQESEADLLGLDLMARAGFDPRQSVELWRNMAHAGGPQGPDFLSTHPATEQRIRNLQGRMATAMPYFEKARAAGNTPDGRL